MLSTHNLAHLFNYIQEKLGVGFSHDTKRKMRVINGFCFSARYPGDGNAELTRDDIEDCLSAVKACRVETLKLIEQLEKQPPLSKQIAAAVRKGVQKDAKGLNNEPER